VNTKLQRVLEVVNAWEETGKAFFNRNSDDSMTIHIRDPRMWNGHNNEHWQNAREIEEAIHKVTKNTSSIEIDRHAGQLVLRVNKIYGGSK
jgi:hypothetical protein